MAVGLPPLPPQPSISRVNPNGTPTQAQIDYERQLSKWVSDYIASVVGGALPLPTATTLGGVKSATAPTHQFQRGIDGTGSPIFGQPAAADITGLGPLATGTTIAAGSVTGLATIATTGLASDLIGSVTVATPTATTLGGLFSGSAPAFSFVIGVDTSGNLQYRQPAFTDIGGQVAATQLPTPGAATLGGVNSLAAVSNKFLTSIGTDGSVTQAQPTAADVSGLAAIATSGSASDLGTGTLPAGRLPNPSSTTLGGIQSKAVVSHQFLTGISTSGVPSAEQPAVADLSDGFVGTGGVVLSQNPTITGTALFTGTVSTSILGATTATITTAHTTNLDATTAAFTTATIGTLTTNTVSGGFASLSNTSNSAQLHLSGTGNDDGAYFIGYQQSGAIFAGGASYNGTTWTAKYTTASSFSTIAGAFLLTANTGLTIGSTFTPTVIFQLDTTGAITQGLWKGTAVAVAYGGTGVSTASANTLFAGPTSGAAAAPAFRAIVGADLPNPAAATLGGVKSLAAVTHKFLTSIGTDGLPVAAQPTANDVIGTTTNDNATAGNIGEYVTASAAAITLTNSTQTNLTSVSLTAGDWDVWFDATFIPAATTTTTQMIAGMNTVTATVDLTEPKFHSNNYASSVLGNNSTSCRAGPWRVSIASTTTIYGNTYSVFGTSTMQVRGMLRARRMR